MKASRAVGRMSVSVVDERMNASNPGDSQAKEQIIWLRSLGRYNHGIASAAPARAGGEPADCGTAAEGRGPVLLVASLDRVARPSATRGGRTMPGARVWSYRAPHDRR